jgi:release factor glutamine methyltransferase
MNIQEALQESKEILKNVSFTADLDAEVLLSKVLNKDVRLEKITNSSYEITEKEKKDFNELIKLRKKRIPLAKLLKVKDFWNFEVNVDNKVLIPRPETEVLIDLIVSKISKNKKINFFELGIGSGCISMSILDHFKNAKGIAWDVSKQSIVSSTKNIKKYGFEQRLKIEKRDGLLFRPKQMFDLIVSNPPYLKLSDYISLDKAIKVYEPKNALIADNDLGLKFYNRIIKFYKLNLKLGGLLALEIGDNQFYLLYNLLLKNGFRIEKKYRLINNQVRCLVDLQDHLKL